MSINVLKIKALYDYKYKYWSCLYGIITCIELILLSVELIMPNWSKFYIC